MLLTGTWATPQWLQHWRKWLLLFYQRFTTASSSDRGGTSGAPLCLWRNVDGFILCQSHADNQSCQTVLQPYYIPIRAFHSTPLHSPPLLSFPLPPFHNVLEVWRKLARVRHLGPSGFMNVEPCFCHTKLLRDWLISRLRGRYESERKVRPGQGLCLEMGTASKIGRQERAQTHQRNLPSALQ